jgi:hypothetical protein
LVKEWKYFEEFRVVKKGNILKVSGLQKNGNILKVSGG